MDDDRTIAQERLCHVLIFFFFVKSYVLVFKPYQTVRKTICIVHNTSPINFVQKVYKWREKNVISSNHKTVITASASSLFRYFSYDYSLNKWNIFILTEKKKIANDTLPKVTGVMSTLSWIQNVSDITALIRAESLPPWRMSIFFSYGLS